jgi:acyl-CoA thioesterase FadM
VLRIYTAQYDLEAFCVCVLREPFQIPRRQPVPGMSPDVPTARLDCDGPEPFRVDGGRVSGDWIDYNGHMVDASYAIAFSKATTALLAWLGIGSEYVRRDGGTVYTAEMHLSFLREVRAGERLAYASVVLGVDDKRLHVLHTLLAGDDGERSSPTCELLFLHADHATHRVVPFPSTVRSHLARMAAAHAPIPWPAQARRTIELR